MSNAGRRWAESGQLQHPLLLRVCQAIFGLGVTVLFARPVIKALGSGRTHDQVAVLVGVAVGCAAVAILSVGWDRLPTRGARWLFWASIVGVAVIVQMLWSADLAEAGFAGAVMLCLAAAVVLALCTGWPRGLADAMPARLNKSTRRDEYVRRRERAGKWPDIGGQAPPITTFALPKSDQAALVALADQLRRSRRRFRPGAPARGRLLVLGDDTAGKDQLARAVAYRADSPLLRSDWTDWQQGGDPQAAFTTAFAEARQRHFGVIVMDGVDGRLDEATAAALASVIDSINRPLILIVTAAEARDLDRAVTGSLNRTIRLDAPPF